MHNDRVRKLWPPTSVPTPEELRQFDQTSSEGVNGDDGGDYSPTTPLGAGGAGVTVYGAGGFSGLIRTGTRKASGGGLVLGDSDYPVITPAVSRTFVMGLRDFASRADGLRWQDDTASLFGRFPFPYDESVPGRLANLSQSVNSGPQARQTVLYCPIPSKYLIHGATFSDFHLRWRWGSTTPGPFPPGVISPKFPSFRVLRVQNGTYATANEMILLPPWVTAMHYNIGDVVVSNTGLNGHQYRVVRAGISFLDPSFASHTTDGELWTEFSAGMQFQTEPLGGGLLSGGSASFASAAWGGVAFGSPGTAVAYYGGGAPRDIAVPKNALQNTTIDLVNYSYFLHVADGQTSQLHNSPGVFFHSFVITMSNVAALRPTY